MSSSFNISVAIRSGYQFVGREWRYLARFSLLPFGVTLISSVLMHQISLEQNRIFSIFEDFLWKIPSFVLLGWLMFLEARLLLLGERAGMLPGDAAYREERRNALWASITTLLLFLMGVWALFAYLDWGFEKINPVIRFSCLFFFGASIWAIRFSVAYILAAVNYPMRSYIFRVNGIFISLRLASLFFLTVLPVIVIESGLTTLILPEEVRKAFVEKHQMPQLSESTAISLMAVGTLSDIISALLITAVSAYALKDILSRPRQEKAA
jgi:hypothetical protein